MKQRHMTIAAISCGLLCALCIGLFLWSAYGQANAARAEALARYGGEQVEVCVATRDVTAGERLDASAVEARLWVADLLPEGAISQGSEIVGRTVTSSILKGEVITEKRFEESQGSFDIPQGLEAVSVPAKAVQAVGGAIQPGMSVDVYSSGSSGTTPLARGVIVLATSVGDSGSIVSNDTGFITLAVDPKKTEELIAASSKTNLYFVLPAADDRRENGSDKETSGEKSSPSSKSDKSNGKGDSGSGEPAKKSNRADSAKGAEIDER